MKCVVGVDLGGTNVRAGAFFEDGSSAGTAFSNPSHGQKGAVATIEAVAETIHQAIAASSAPVESVGVAIPGHVDDASGLVRWAPNLGEDVGGIFKYWSDVPFRQMLAKKIEQPIHLDNDANMAALGEYRFGLGRNQAKCLVMLTLGTGVGGGVILSPDAVLGAARGPLVMVGGNKGGAELGHVVIAYNGVECNAGEYGAIEGYCQRDAIVRRVELRIKRGRQSLITELVEGDLTKITPRLVSEAAERGDETCIEVWEEVGTMLGVAIGNYINIFAPDVLAIGGNIARAGDLLMKPAMKTARNIAIRTLFEDAKVGVAEQIDDAGMLGGAALALESLKWGR